MNGTFPFLILDSAGGLMRPEGGINVLPLTFFGGAEDDKPSLHPNVLAQLALRGQEKEAYDTELILPESSPPVAVRVFNLSDGFLILPAFRGEVDLQLSYAMAALNAIDDVVWINMPDLSGLIYVNPAFERVWGVSPEELFKDISIFFNAVVEEDRAKVIETLEKQYRGEPFSHEYRIRNRNGDIRWIRDKAFPVRNGDGSVKFTAGIASDVTQLRNLADTKMELERAKLLSRVTGELSHSFNNLLSQIEFAVAAIVKTDLNRLSINAIESALQKGRSLNAYVNALSENGVANVVKVQVDLYEFVDKHWINLIDAVGEGVQLILERPIVTADVIIDVKALAEAMTYLVINAREAMNGSGVLRLRLQAAPPSLETLVRDRDEVRVPIALEFIDVGSGFEPEIVLQAIEPFVSSKSAGHGLGLGLSAAHATARDHGGALAIRGKPRWRGNRQHCSAHGRTVTVGGRLDKAQRSCGRR